MQDSLGGTAQVALIVCGAPAAQDASESLSALRFGTRAAGIVNSLQLSPLSSPPCQILRAENELFTPMSGSLFSNTAGEIVKLQDPPIRSSHVHLRYHSTLTLM